MSHIIYVLEDGEQWSEGEPYMLIVNDKEFEELSGSHPRQLKNYKNRTKINIFGMIDSVYKHMDAKYKVWADDNWKYLVSKWADDLYESAKEAVDGSEFSDSESGDEK
jgi:hypothetical protein